MSVPAPPRFADLAQPVLPPDPDLAVRARQLLAAPPQDRVAELAAWWAGVRRDPAAGAPAHLVQLRRPGTAAGGLPEWYTRRVQPVDLPAELPVAEALDWGVARADEWAGTADLLVVSLDRDPALDAAAAQLLGLDPVEALGWPAQRGLDDAEWMVELVALRDRLRGLAGLRPHLDRLLAAVGDPGFAAAVTAILRATATRTPVLLDGAGASAAALVVRQAAFDAPLWWQAAGLGNDPLQRRALTALRLEPLTRVGADAADGSGPALAVAMLDLAAGRLAAAGAP